MRNQSQTDRFTVQVTLQDRPDGGLRVFSEDLPGLILSGPDKHRVSAAVVPAIAALCGRLFGGEFNVVPSRSPVDALNEKSPRTVDVMVHERDQQVYIVESKRVA